MMGRVAYGSRRHGLRSVLSLAAALLLAAPAQAQDRSHVFVFSRQRLGAAPCEPGTGWRVECFYDIPEPSVGNLRDAELYVNGVEPTFTFHTDYLDWPAGDPSVVPDTEFATLGDFLNDYISDVSDPEALDLPFDRHFLLRASGGINIRLVDSSYPYPTPPVFFEMGLVAADGGKIFIDPTTIVRLLLPEPPPSFIAEDPVTDLPGVYPFAITYLQRFDPDNRFGAGNAGFELLTCHRDGLPLASGVHLEYRCGYPGLAIPPWYVYQPESIQPILECDFEVDGDVDLADFSHFQRCYTGPGNENPFEYGCFIFDSEGDDDVDLADFDYFFPLMTEPNGC